MRKKQQIRLLSIEEWKTNNRSGQWENVDLVTKTRREWARKINKNIDQGKKKSHSPSKCEKESTNRVVFHQRVKDIY